MSRDVRRFPINKNAACSRRGKVGEDSSCGLEPAKAEIDILSGQDGGVEYRRPELL